MRVEWRGGQAARSGQDKDKVCARAGTGENERSPWQLTTARGREREGHLWAPLPVSGCGGLSLTVCRNKNKAGVFSCGMHSCCMSVWYEYLCAHVLPCVCEHVCIQAPHSL